MAIKTGPIDFGAAQDPFEDDEFSNWLDQLYPQDPGAEPFAIDPSAMQPSAQTLAASVGLPTASVPGPAAIPMAPPPPVPGLEPQQPTGWNDPQYNLAMAEGMRWGLPPEATTNILQKRLQVGVSGEEAKQTIESWAVAAFGPMPAGATTEEGFPIAPWQWAQMQEQARVRQRGAIHTYPEGARPVEGQLPRSVLEPGNWPEGMFTRQDAASVYPISAITGAGYYPAGTTPGSVMLPPSVGEGKEAKRVQLTGAYESLGAYRIGPMPEDVVDPLTGEVSQRPGFGKQSLSMQTPFPMGPEARTPERGIRLRAGIPMVEVTPSGMGLAKPGAIYGMTQNRPVDIPIPQGFVPEDMPGIGRTWGRGEQMIPFAGGSPVEMGAWDWMKLTGRAIIPGAEGEDDIMRLLFERRRSPSHGEAEIKYLGHKITLPQAYSTQAFERFVGGQADIEAILPGKEWMGVAAETMLAFPREEIAGILGTDVAGLKGMTWQQAAPQLLGYFREHAAEWTRNIPYTLRFSRPEYEAVPEETRRQWFAETTPMGQGFEVTTQPIPTLVPPHGIFTALKRSYPGTMPFVPYRELERIQRTDPREYARVMKEARPWRAAYGQLLRATYASEVRQPLEDASQLTPELAAAIVSGAQSRALEAFPQAEGDTTKIPQEIMQAQIVQGLASHFGNQPISLGENQYMMSPRAMLRLGSARGALEEGEYGGIARAAARVVQAAQAATDLPEEYQERVGRYIQAQATAGMGQNVLRRALGAPTPRTGSEGTVAMSTALSPEQRYRPAEEVMRNYGIRPDTEAAEQFMEDWKAGRIRPTEMGTRFPPAGGDVPFEARYELIHPDKLLELGINLDPNTRLIASSIYQKAQQGDADADREYRRVIGRAIQDEQGKLALVGTGDVSSAESIIARAEQAVQWGAADLQREEFLSGPGNIEKMLENLEPTNWRERTGADLIGSLESDLALRHQIGPLYNVVENIETMARRGGAGPEQVSGAVKLFGLTYGVAQRPAELPEHVRQIMQIARTGKPWTGGYAGEGSGGWTQGQGFGSLLRGTAEQLLQATLPGTALRGEGSLFSVSEAAGLIGQLGQPTGALSGLIQKWGQQTQAGNLTRAEITMSEILSETGIMRGERAISTTLGATLMPLWTRRAEQRATGQPRPGYDPEKEAADIERARAWLGTIPEGLREQLQGGAEAIFARRAALSKHLGFGERIAGAFQEAPEIMAQLGFTPEMMAAAQQAGPTAQQPTAAPRGVPGLSTRTITMGGGTLEDVERRVQEDQAAARRFAGQPRSIFDEVEEIPFSQERVQQRTEEMLAEERRTGRAFGAGGGGRQPPTGGEPTMPFPEDEEEPGGGWQPTGGGEPRPRQGKTPSYYDIPRWERVGREEFMTAVTGLARGLPVWQRDIAPRIKRGEELTSEEEQSMRKLGGYQRTARYAVSLPGISGYAPETYKQAMDIMQGDLADAWGSLSGYSMEAEIQRMMRGLEGQPPGMQWLSQAPLQAIRGAVSFPSFVGMGNRLPMPAGGYTDPSQLYGWMSDLEGLASPDELMAAARQNNANWLAGGRMLSNVRRGPVVDFAGYGPISPWSREFAGVAAQSPVMAYNAGLQLEPGSLTGIGSLGFLSERGGGLSQLLSSIDWTDPQQRQANMPLLKTLGGRLKDLDPIYAAIRKAEESGQDVGDVLERVAGAVGGVPQVLETAGQRARLAQETELEDVVKFLNLPEVKEQLEGLGTRAKEASERLGDMTDILKEIRKEPGKRLGEEEGRAIREAQEMLRRTQEGVRLGAYAGLTAREQEEMQLQATTTGQMLRDLGYEREMYEPGIGQRALRGAEGVAKHLMSGWGMMQLRRMWGMTGGVAMGAIPVAAQEEQAAVAAGMVGMPLDQYQPGGMAMNLMTLQAQRQNFQLEMGQAAYGGYGWALGAGGRGLGTAAGIGLPAVGAGLVGGLVAGWAGLSAVGVGVPLALGAGAIGTQQYMATAARDEERMALAAAGEGNILERLAAGWSAQIGDRTVLSPLLALTQQGLQDQRREYGQRLMTGELEGLSGAGRIAAIQYAAEQATQRRGPLEFMSQTQAEQMAAQWMRYTPGATNINEIFQDPRFAQMALSGQTPEAYGNLAQAWGALPTDWQQMQGVMGGMTGPEQLQFQYSSPFLSPFARFGLTPEQAARMGPVSGAQNRQFLQGLAGGSQWAWSQLGREAGVTGWQTQSAEGISIGVNWGGGILGGYMGQVGAPGANVQMAGGNVMLAGQPVAFTQWGLQDFSQQQQRGYQDWQYQFQMQGMALQQQRQYQMWGFEDEATALQRGYQRQQFGFQAGDIARNDRQFMERWRMQYQQLGITSGWEEQDRETQYRRQMVQFGWQEEDLAFRGAQSQLQFGWQMEDLEESERFATGRQRRQIRRQRERATISFGMSMGRLDEEEGRLDQRREWAEEDYNKAKDRHEETLEWRRAEMELSRRHHEEDVEAQRDRLDASRRYFEETAELQDRQRDAARDYWQETHDRQEEALRKEREYQNFVRQAQDAQTALARAQLLHLSRFRAEFEAGSLLDREMHSFIDRIVDHLQEAGDAMDSYLSTADSWNHGTIGGR